MLDEIKVIYQEAADCVKNEVSKMTKQELFDKCIEVRNDSYLFDAYFSALVCVYWSKIATYYNRSKPAASEEDCYNWLIDNLVGVIDYKPWKDPNNKLAKDPNAGDKVLNKTMFCTRANFFQALQRDKRKAYLNSSSLDELVEEFKDAVLPSSYDPDISINIYIKDRIKGFFWDSKRYEEFFLLNIILNEKPFNSKGEIDYNKCYRYMQSIDDTMCQYISDEYDIPYSKIRDAANYIPYDSKKSSKNLPKEILQDLRYLCTSNEFLSNTCIDDTMKKSTNIKDSDTYFYDTDSEKKRVTLDDFVELW